MIRLMLEHVVGLMEYFKTTVGHSIAVKSEQNYGTQDIALVIEQK